MLKIAPVVVSPLVVIDMPDCEYQYVGAVCFGRYYERAMKTVTVDMAWLA